MQNTTTAQKTAPAAANAVSVTPSGTNWGSSAWVTVVSSTAAASVITGIIIADFTISGFLTPAEFEVDLGVGAAGSEVVIATLRGFLGYSGGWSHGYLPFPIPIDNVPSGARIAVRMRRNGTDTTAWKFAITYLQKPITGTLLVSAQATKVAPAAADAIVLPSTGGTAWVSAAWGTVLAAAGADLIIIGAVIPNVNATNEYEIDIGRGGAGSEQVIATFKGFSDSGSGGSGPTFVALPNPVSGVLAGYRIAARARTAVSTVALKLALVYMELPL